MPETERNALRLNWPVYEQIGAPKFNDLYELIPIMKRMLAARPVGDNGSPTFGTVLNNGSDTEYWANIQMYYSFFGYQPYFMKYLLETDMVNNKINTILDKNSRYYEGLKWYYTLNREGLIDPDSINNDRPTQKAKVDAGNVMMPSGTNPGWTPRYFPYLMPGQKVYYSFSSPYGGNETIGISAKTTKLDACLKLLDIFAAPEFHTILRGGPEGRGEGWYTDERGNAFPTQRLLDFYKSQDQSSGFILSSGDRLELNFNSSVIVNTGILTKYGDSKGGYRPAFTNEWPEITEISLQNPVFKQWQKTTGHVNWQEWVNAENAWVKESPLNRLNTFTSTPDNIIQLTIDAIRDVVVNASWQMVYAKTDAEFENIWSKMVADCKGLGVDDLQKWAFVDIEKAKAVKASLEK
jgi:hypothetical protein